MKKYNKYLFFYCPKCRKYQRSSAYFLSSKGKNVIWCKYCGKIIYNKDKLKRRKRCCSCGELKKHLIKKLCNCCYLKKYYRSKKRLKMDEESICY